ncbi:MAG: aldolase/citrate lyase family protein [Chloroflexota bacterium]|nr:aldolase/citrate lyase family protein [Chloroflexota bacterium]
MLGENKAKAKIKAGQPAVGCQMMFVHPTVVELAGRAGFDWVLFDGEHGPVTPESVEIGALAAENIGLTPLARVPVNRPEVILRFMDTGLAGVLVPHVDTADDAEAAVRAVKYHPRGERGLAGVRASGYGSTPLAEYIEHANRQTMVLVMIESAAAVANIEAIAAVDGVDVLNVGQSDLSQSMGKPGRRDDPEVRAAVERVIEVGTKAGKAVAVGGGPSTDWPTWREKGATWFGTNVIELILTSGRQIAGSVR